MPRGLETLGAVPPVEVVEVPVPPLSDEPVPGGPQGLGKGSLFSVLEGCTPEFSKLPPKAEKGLFPNYVKDTSTAPPKKHYFNIFI